MLTFEKHSLLENLLCLAFVTEFVYLLGSLHLDKYGLLVDNSSLLHLLHLFISRLGWLQLYRYSLP